MIDRQRLEHLGVPAGIAASVAASSFEWARPAVVEATRFAESRDLLLVLAGPTQAGKSSAAAVAAALARVPGREVNAFLPAEPDEEGAWRDSVTGGWYRTAAVSLGGKLRQGAWLHAPATATHVFNESLWSGAEVAGVLVVDDLGLEPGEARVRDRLLGLLVGRYDAARPTIVSTNLDAASFRLRYCAGAGERLAARIGGRAWHQVARVSTSTTWRRA